MKELNVNFTTSTIFSLNKDFFLTNNVKTLFLDLDNTCCQVKQTTPSKQLFIFIDLVKRLGIRVVLISNNFKKRVDYFARKLNVEYIYLAFKPFKFKLNRFIKKNHIKKENSLYIGDQIYKDVILANRLNLKVVLVETKQKPHISNLPFLLLEKLLKKELKKQNKLGIHI